MKLDFEISDLVNFLLKARLKGYAGDGKKEEKPERPGFKEFYYKEEDFEYRDSYAGYFQAPGQEVIRFKGKPVWTMSYSGGMLPEFHGDLELAKETFAFLKKTLQHVDPKKPFRGPEYFKELDKFGDTSFQYIDDNNGDVTNFEGVETILKEIDGSDVDVFRQNYVGGLIIDKP
ncbi:MAG: DUF5680 domain-containing protein [Candidatus Woesearchaeota archaeon]|nr:DUF5680 domain-containing protein [Candidatus Woesearchaeota archaeon]